MPFDRSSPGGDAPLPGAVPFVLPGSADLLALGMAANGWWFERLAHVGDEIGGFLGRRLQAEMATCGALAAARSPADAAAICARHWATAIRDYGEEGQRVAALLADLAQESVGAVAAPLAGARGAGERGASDPRDTPSGR